MSLTGGQHALLSVEEEPKQELGLVLTLLLRTVVLRATEILRKHVPATQTPVQVGVQIK